MKKTLITAAIIFTAVSVSAQIVFRTDSIPVAGKRDFSIYSDSHITGKSPKGTVYRLPQDHMPALKPDTTFVYKMPVISLRHNPAMISIPKQLVPNPLVPKKQKELLQLKTPDGLKQIKIH